MAPLVAVVAIDHVVEHAEREVNHAARGDAVAESVEGGVEREGEVRQVPERPLKPVDVFSQRCGQIGAGLIAAGQLLGRARELGRHDAGGVGDGGAVAVDVGLVARVKFGGGGGGAVMQPGQLFANLG